MVAIPLRTKRPDLGADRGRPDRALHLPTREAQAPQLAPVHADLHGLPPMLIQVGSAETLLAYAVRLARAAGAAGVRVNLEVWPDMIHAWTLFYQQVAAGRRALRSVGAFVRSNLA
jgi:epsilon-lactone hydrolase